MEFGVTLSRTSQVLVLCANEARYGVGGRRQQALELVVDEVGVASAKAQGLPVAITSAARLRKSQDRVYLAADGSRCLGLLRVGRKRLFLHDSAGRTHQVEPLCVLDFYVHESCQRRGVGKGLLDAVLAAEALDVSEVAFDKPSNQCLEFLRKHYGLGHHEPQANNFVVLPAFFERLNRPKPFFWSPKE
jgi:alpha-tubulin N-acetyltransferase 1